MWAASTGEAGFPTVFRAYTGHLTPPNLRLYRSLDIADVFAYTGHLTPPNLRLYRSLYKY